MRKPIMPFCLSSGKAEQRDPLNPARPVKLHKHYFTGVILSDNSLVLLLEIRVKRGSQAEGLRLMAMRKKEGVSQLTPFSYARCHFDFKHSSAMICVDPCPVALRTPCLRGEAIHNLQNLPMSPIDTYYLKALSLTESQRRKRKPEMVLFGFLNLSGNSVALASLGERA